MQSKCSMQSADQRIQSQTGAKDAEVVANCKYQAASDGNSVDEKEKKDQSSSVRMTCIQIFNMPIFADGANSLFFSSYFKKKLLINRQPVLLVRLSNFEFKMFGKGCKHIHFLGILH